MHRAGAAQRHAAAEFCAGHAEDVAQYPEQRCVAVDIDGVRVAVNFDGEGHGLLSLFSRCSTAGCRRITDPTSRMVLFGSDGRRRR